MTGACVNFEPMQSAMQAVMHASRAVAPTYLLAPEFSLGTIVVVDDKNTVSQTLERKLELASRQAKREKNFSPMWEGVINLERPVIDANFDAIEYKKRSVLQIQKWIVEYEKLTGHKVLRADIHLDEGRIEEDKLLMNSHAHVMVDRTTEKGRVIKLSPGQMREIQTMTSATTGLLRGESSSSGRKHVDHRTYKLLQDQAKAELKIELGKIKSQYDQDRAALKATGAALQSDYKKLKERYEAFKVKAHEAVDKGNVIIANLSKENETMKKELADVRAQAAADLAELTGMSLAEARQKADAAAQRLEAKAQVPVIDWKAAKTLVKSFGAVKKASKGNLEQGRVVGAVPGLVVLHIGKGVHVFHKLPAGAVLPEVGKPLNAKQREGRGGIAD